MSSERARGEHLHFEKASEELPSSADGNVVNAENDLQENKTSDPFPKQSTMMEQLEDYVRAGDQAAVRQLLDRQAVDLKTVRGNDLLWAAYTLEKTEIAAMLVRYGADLNVRKLLDNRTLLHDILRGSIRIGDTATRELFRLMLAHGADVDARDNEGKSLLQDAIACSHRASIELSEELLKRGARMTISYKDRRMNDIYMACKHKIEFVSKLIQYQEPDEETRDRRATLAIEFLISENCTGAAGAAALLMVEKILGLGVPVDVPDSLQNKRKLSFLDTALAYKNVAMIELLLKCGADVSEKKPIGHTILHRATAFKGTTQVTRWFIDRGVGIQTRSYNGEYSIHGACKNKCAKNIHLLLNIGADLNSTDRSGQTPFSMMKMKKNQKATEAHELVIKHLALMIARGEKISKKDEVQMDKYYWSKNYFADCMKQLALMKIEKVHNETSYFFFAFNEHV